MFVTAAVNVGAYSLFVNFVGPMLGIDPTRLGAGHQIAGVALISLSHALLNHFGIRADDAAHRLFRLADPRRRARC